MNKFIFLYMFLVTTVLSCSQKKQLNVTKQDQSEEKVTAMQEKSTDEPCYEDREVTKEVTEEKATITKILDQYMFTTESRRWQPCDVPTEFQEEGLKVIVSGQVMNIFPYERRAGTPFRTTALRKDI